MTNRNLSDEEIRKLLAKMNRQAKKAERRAEVFEIAKDVMAWGALIFIIFMLSVIGG